MFAITPRIWFSLFAVAAALTYWSGGPDDSIPDSTMSAVRGLTNTGKNRAAANQTCEQYIASQSPGLTVAH